MIFRVFVTLASVSSSHNIFHSPELGNPGSSAKRQSDHTVPQHVREIRHGFLHLKEETVVKQTSG